MKFLSYCLLLVFPLVALTQIIETERRYPKKWSKPKIVVTPDGQTTVVPSAPIEFEDEKTGGDAGVKVSVHGLEIPDDIQTISRPVIVLGVNDKRVKVEPRKDVWIDRERFKVLGTSGDFLYVKSYKTRSFGRFPLAVSKEKNEEQAAKSDKKEE